MFLTDLKSGKPAMAQTTKKKLGLGSAISQAERKDYQSKFDEQAEFPPDTLSDSERNELRKLGFDRNKICYLSEDVLSMGSRRMSMAFALGYLTGREGKYTILTFSD